MIYRKIFHVIKLLYINKLYLIIIIMYILYIHAKKMQKVFALQQMFYRNKKYCRHYLIIEQSRQKIFF